MIDNWDEYYESLQLADKIDKYKLQLLEDEYEWEKDEDYFNRLEADLRHNQWDD